MSHQSDQAKRREASLFMADASSSSSSTCSSNWSSPISSISSDQLFTILLLLPVDSIVSFSMTCKRLRDLASSDTLWESICRREWGSSWVDVLKSSYSSQHHQQQYQLLPWKRVYKQVSRLQFVSCHNLSQPDPQSTFPSPRASHSLNFVSESLVLFGGGREGGRHLDDTWAAYIGNDFEKTLEWQKVHSGIPSGRFGHSCVVISDILVLFGGINDNGNRQNDTWVGKLSWNKTLGIRFSWRLLTVGPIAPPPRGAHAASCIDDKKMVIHGGIGLGGIRLGDTWILEVSENLHFGTWHEVVVHPSPPARSGHTLTSIGGGRTVLFGGRGLGYEVLNDIWLLDVFKEQIRWVQIHYELQNIPEGASLPRVGHSSTFILGGFLLIYGGEDSYRHRKDDFWLLDMSVIPSIRVQQQQPTSLNSVQLLSKMWKRLNVRGYNPNARSFHRACADHSGRSLYVLGGMVDGLLQPAEASGLRFDGELFLVELVPHQF